ncbi:MAG: MarC family protein [Candidatus Lokiarchaeota archaeon]|nr:MarC family protein [Candidatus Lokiarchaeota archaeon]
MLELINDNVLDLAKAIIVLFIMVDPLGNIPIFMCLTEKMPKKQKTKTFNTATIVSIILLLLFAFAGQEIFSIFGVSIFSFQIAGGILLLIIAIRLIITGKIIDLDQNPESVGAVPIAMPLLVGPGAITTAIFSLQQYGIVITTLAIITTLVITWIILRSVNKIYHFLGKSGALVIAQVNALFIAAIAIQYILMGITQFIPL